MQKLEKNVVHKSIYYIVVKSFIKGHLSECSYVWVTLNIPIGGSKLTAAIFFIIKIYMAQEGGLGLVGPPLDPPMKFLVYLQLFEPY